MAGMRCKNCWWGIASYQTAVHVFEVQKLHRNHLIVRFAQCPPHLQAQDNLTDAFNCFGSNASCMSEAVQLTVADTPRPHSSNSSYASAVVGYSLRSSQI